MKSTRTVGLSFLQNKIQLAEVEHGKKLTLTCLAERDTAMDFSTAGTTLTAGHPQLANFVAELRDLLKQNMISPATISFALPPEPMFIAIIPADPGLKGAEWTAHLQWETAQYFPGVSPKEFILDSHRLPLEGSGTPQAFMVAIRRGMVAFLQKVAAELKSRMHIVDVDQFSTEKTLITNYPEILEHDIVLFCLRPTGVDASLIHHGQMTDYRAFPSDGSVDPRRSITAYLKYVKERYSANQPAALLLHGAQVTQDLVVGLRGETGIKQTVALNAVRKLPVSDKIYRPYVKESQRFAAAIGLALRT